MNIETANRLLQLRKANNLSQEALAEKLSVSRQAVSKWERAEASPDTDNLIALARLYGMSLDELLGTGGQRATEKETQESELKDPVPHGDSQPGRKKKIVLLGVPFAALVAIIYFIVGWKTNYSGNEWILFLLIPLWYSLMRAIGKKDAMRFAYPVVAVIVFTLCMGKWDLAWIVFLTIPIYYGVVRFLKTRKQ